MIFDFYLTYDFNHNHERDHLIFKFLKEPLYTDIKGSEVSGGFEDGYFSFLHRGDYENSYIETEDINLWIFGTVFTNKSYAIKTGVKPFRIMASELLRLYKENPEKLTEKIKGSFVLIILNKKIQKISLITDRHNLLPLYYTFDDGLLIISSNFSAILKNKFVSKQIDEQAFTEQLLFDYILDDRSFFKNIKRIKSATIYHFSSEGMNSFAYWDVSLLYNEELLDKNESLDLLGNLLHENVNLYVSDIDKALVSLTGGFDGRCNLALLDLPVNNYLCYSYGMPGSKQIKVPQNIASKTGIHYKPVVLDEDFIKNYEHYSKLATYFSNGTAPIGFCNISYAFKQLSSFSDIVITGLLGSEILRPLFNLGHQINDQSYEIFLSDDYEKAIDKVINRTVAKNLIDPEIILASKDRIKEFFISNYFEKYSNYDKIARFFFFIINEGVRKYFSQEIQIERVFVTTRVPYFDNDLVDLIYQSQFAGMYNGFLGKSKFKRRKGQLLYAHIIKRYRPELGQILLDRGYTPNDLLLPFPFNYLQIAPGVFRFKRYMRKAQGNDTFKTKIWSDDTIKKSIQIPNSISNQIFSDRLKVAYESHSNFENFLTYRHLVSLHNFFEQL